MLFYKYLMVSEQQNLRWVWANPNLGPAQSHFLKIWMTVST